MFRQFFVFLLVLIFFVSCNNSTETEINKEQITKYVSDTGNVAVITKQIIKDSKNPKLYVKRAKVLLQNNQIQDAISDLEAAIKLDSTNTDYLNLISDYWIVNGNSKPAKQYLDKSLKINPDNPQTLLRMSKIYLYIKDYMKSFEYANKAIKNDASLYQPYFVKGLCYSEIGDSLRAIKEFQKTISLNPDFYDAYQLLGVLCTKTGDSLAASYFKIAQKLNPESTEAYYGLAYYYQQNNQLDKAIEEYNYIITNIDSAYSDAYYNIAYINLVYYSDYDKAIEFFNLSKKYNPNNPNTYYNIGLCYQKKGNKSKAKTNYEKALKLNPNHSLSKDALKNL